MSLQCFDQLVGELRQTLAGLPDKRKGSNTMYSMETIGLSAFSVFFTQSPSFLAHQKTMEQNKGLSNAQTLFQIEKTPSDNHVRDMLDPVEPQAIYPVYDRVYEAFEEQGILDTFRSVHNTRLIALDGTWYFSSPRCLHRAEFVLRPPQKACYRTQTVLRRTTTATTTANEKNNTGHS